MGLEIEGIEILVSVPEGSVRLYELNKMAPHILEMHWQHREALQRHQNETCGYFVGEMLVTPHPDAVGYIQTYDVAYCPSGGKPQEDLKFRGISRLDLDARLKKRDDAS